MALLRPPPPFASSATAPPVIVYPRTNLFPLLFVRSVRPSVRPLAGWRRRTWRENGINGVHFNGDV